jgi:hypothetical protein
VIADSQYDAIEYPSRHGWGHTCAEDTVQLACSDRRPEAAEARADFTAFISQLKS